MFFETLLPKYNFLLVSFGFFDRLKECIINEPIIPIISNLLGTSVFTVNEARGFITIDIGFYLCYNNILHKFITLCSIMLKHKVFKS